MHKFEPIHGCIFCLDLHITTDSPGTEMSSLEALSLPHQRTMAGVDDQELLDPSTGSALFEAGDAGRVMSTQASLDDGSDGTLPPKNEVEQSNSGSHSKGQSDPTNRPSTSLSQQAEDELETVVSV